MSIVTTLIQTSRPVLRGLDWLQPVFSLAVRLYVANVFWKSGINKVQSWDNTVLLFTHEYQVPVLSPTLAAFLGTGVELIFPLLLALGLGARFAAAILFVFNIVAVISYPELSEIGIKDHFYWGALLLVPLLYGPGKLSIDCWLRRRYGA